MGLVGKLVSRINVKLDADIHHQIFKEKPHQMSDICPSKIKSCDLHQGQLGTAGCVVIWNFTLDGEEMVSKEMIETIDDEKKLVTYKVIDGDLKKIYRTFKFTIQVDSNGDNSVVTWTMDYEKMNVNVPDPQTLMDLCLQMTKDIDLSRHTVSPTLLLTNTV